MFKWNFPCCIFCPLLLVPSLGASEKSLAQSSLLSPYFQVFMHTGKIPVCVRLPLWRLKKSTKIFNHTEAYICFQDNQAFQKTLCIQNTYWWTPSTSQSFPTSLGAMFCRVLGQISINLQRSDQPICKKKKKAAILEQIFCWTSMLFFNILAFWKTDILKSYLTKSIMENN